MIAWTVRTNSCGQQQSVTASGGQRVALKCFYHHWHSKLRQENKWQICGENTVPVASHKFSLGLLSSLCTTKFQEQREFCSTIRMSTILLKRKGTSFVNNQQMIEQCIQISNNGLPIRDIPRHPSELPAGGNSLVWDSNLILFQFTCQTSIKRSQTASMFSQIKIKYISTISLSFLFCLVRTLLIEWCMDCKFVSGRIRLWHVPQDRCSPCLITSVSDNCAGCLPNRHWKDLKPWLPCPRHMSQT